MNISIVDKNICVGCGSCASSCRNKVIQMKESMEGFLYPEINNDCTNCGVCLIKCPVYNPIKKEKYISERYALILKEKHLLDYSSSGGIFAGFAKYFIQNGGIVYGAAYDKKLCVKHIGIDNLEDLNVLQGSKYVASEVFHLFEQIKEQLQNDCLILFSGTPCQIAGLKSFLGKDYENLLTMDLICHGTPSSKLFRKYLKWLELKFNDEIVYYGFRDKAISGWSCCKKILVKTNNKCVILDGISDPYCYAFLNCQSYRESCYKCSYANFDKRIGDITIGDFWGTNNDYPEIPREEGIGYISINSKKGKRFFDLVKNNFYLFECKNNEVLMGNIALHQPSDRPEIRNTIYNDIDGDIDEYFSKFENPSIISTKIKSFIRRFIPHSVLVLIKNVIRK